MYARGGSKRRGRSGGSPPGEKNSEFLILLLIMACFNWNDSKYGIYFYFSCQQGGISPPLWCWVGGPDPPPVETLWGHSQKSLLHWSHPLPLKSYAFQHSPHFKNILHFIFIPNPDIASWQFLPVKHRTKKVWAYPANMDKSPPQLKVEL